MIEVTIYTSATGVIRRTARLMDATEADLNCAADEAWVMGGADLLRDHVVAGQITPKPAASPDLSLAWAVLRAERNRRLTACDWTQVADAPVDQTAWAAYRTALRALPENTPDPLHPVWPIPPANT
jgi:hypothetical protein